MPADEKQDRKTSGRQRPRIRQAIGCGVLASYRLIVPILVAVAFCILPTVGGAAQSVSAIPRDRWLPSSQTQLPDQGSDLELHSPFRTAAADPSNEFRETYLTGDWMGARSRLAHEGINFSLLSIGDPFGNLTGGLQRGASDYNLAAFGILLNTDKLLGWHGGTFHIGFATNFGTSLTQNYVGNSFPIQLADVADPHPRLTYLSYTQEAIEGKLSVRVGRLTINSVSGEEFLGSEYFKAFTSVGVDLVPIGVFLNAPGAFGYPTTTWGARIKFKPARHFYTMVGAYNGDPNLKDGTHNGLDFFDAQAIVSDRRTRLPQELRKLLNCFGQSKVRWLLQRRNQADLRFRYRGPTNSDRRRSLRSIHSWGQDACGGGRGIPPASIAYWEQRLASKNVPLEAKKERMGETVLTFSDPDGMKIELVGHAESGLLKAPRFADVPLEHAIHGFFGVTMLERDAHQSEAALALLGFHKVAEEGNRLRFSAAGDALGNHLDIVVDAKAGRGRPGAGSVHHIAFRSKDYEDQKQWHEVISQYLGVSPVMERDYFRSIYFREPGGVLFELATDIPGFAIDEPLESLGEELRVPQWLGANLAPLTLNLPAVTLHKAQKEVQA